MIESSFTLYKLIILYMLQNVNFRCQIHRFRILSWKRVHELLSSPGGVKRAAGYKADRDREGAQHLVLPHD